MSIIKKPAAAARFELQCLQRNCVRIARCAELPWMLLHRSFLVREWRSNR